MYDALRDVLYGGEFSVVERFEIPGRAASYAPIPRFLFDSRTGVCLVRQFNHRENPLWSHQARALEELGHGSNVVVSTGTASGKSLPDCCRNRKIRYYPDQAGSRFRENPSFPVIPAKAGRKRESRDFRDRSGFPLSRE